MQVGFCSVYTCVVKCLCSAYMQLHLARTLLLGLVLTTVVGTCDAQKHRATTPADAAGSALEEEDGEGFSTASADAAAAASAKFVKIEKMRHRNFSPIVDPTAYALERMRAPNGGGGGGGGGGGASVYSTTAVQQNARRQRSGTNGKRDVPAVHQISLFRNAARSTVAGKLTELVESNRSREKAKQMAKDRIEARMRELFSEEDDNKNDA